MAVEFLKAKKEDFKEIVDFINYIFRNEGEDIYFESFLPKLYKEEYNTFKDHYLVKENKKIKAVVGAFPIELKVLENLPLKVVGIGSVSVHPDSRGKGYMKRLMNMALEDMKNQGVNISFLSGSRQRYEYFGYTPSGQSLSYKIEDENVKHFLRKYINEDITFEEVISNDLEFIDKAYEIYNKKEVKIIREKSKFLNTLKSWGLKVYAIKSKEKFLGYLSGNEEKDYISELIVEEEDFISVLATYMEFNKSKNINLELPIWEKKKIRALNRFSEKVVLKNCTQFNILNYKDVIKVLLEFKGSYTKLKDGSISFSSLNEEGFEIRVKNNKVEVNNFNGKADIELEALEKTQLFFSPFGSYLNEDESLKDIIDSWFPIPLFIGTVDSV